MALGLSHELLESTEVRIMTGGKRGLGVTFGKEIIRHYLLNCWFHSENHVKEVNDRKKSKNHQ